MAYQFIHVDSYARQGSNQKGVTKRSAAEIADEAERHPDACRHVTNPQPPRLLYGVRPHEAVELANKWAETVRDAKGRKLRSDAHALLAGVVSLPAERSGDWEAFKFDTLDWLKQRYGSRLRSVVEHTDEEHPHLHFYVVALDGEPFAAIHDGERSARQAKANGAKKGSQNAAYIGAMRQYQDDFASEVARHYALTRLGPGRRRLTRAQWKAEKAQAAALALALPDAMPKCGKAATYRVPAGRKLPLVGEVFDRDAVLAAYRAGAQEGGRVVAAAYEPLRKAILATQETDTEQKTWETRKTSLDTLKALAPQPVPPADKPKPPPPKRGGPTFNP